MHDEVIPIQKSKCLQKKFLIIDYHKNEESLEMLLEF